jgi:hypothetical protein
LILLFKFGNPLVAVDLNREGGDGAQTNAAVCIRFDNDFAARFNPGGFEYSAWN